MFGRVVTFALVLVGSVILIAIMAAGRIVEEGPAAGVIAAPQSPAARALVQAVPRLETRE